MIKAISISKKSKRGVNVTMLVAAASGLIAGVLILAGCAWAALKLTGCL